MNEDEENDMGNNQKKKNLADIQHRRMQGKLYNGGVRASRKVVRGRESCLGSIFVSQTERLLGHISTRHRWRTVLLCSIDGVGAGMANRE